MILLTIDAVATQLKISKASVKNWEKQGYITPLHNGNYSQSDVDILGQKLNSGEIKKLNSRANKSRSKNKFIPTEYVTKEASIKSLELIINYIIEFNIKPEQALFLLSVNSLLGSGEVSRDNIYEALLFKDDSLFKRRSIFLELKNWFLEIRSGEIKKGNIYCTFLLECELPQERDVLGIIYQSIINEGKKSSLGSYYTPTSLVKEIVDENLKEEGKVLDPCCGTGQFLLTMADKITDPNRIWGADIDRIATRITKINLFLHYSHIDFKPNIYNHNSLVEWDEKDFSLIVTNPPWGAKIEKRDLKRIKENYPQVNSKESFSFFISFALKYLKKGGSYSFVLPESLLYVKNHQDIRSYMINNSTINLIKSSGRLFKNVFSSVIRIDGIKHSQPADSQVLISLNDKEHYVRQDRFLSNVNNIIDIYCDDSDQGLINKVYSHGYVTLKDNAKWALGIVTGNNADFLKENKTEGFEGILKGKDLRPLLPGIPTSFILYTPKKFQQCAPDEFYRAPEKLIYKFISKDLVFSYDDKSQLSLNSANILIPKIDGLPVKVVGAILNSSVHRYIFRKKFNALKVLRGDVESLPIPLFNKLEIDNFLLIINSFIEGITEFSEIDDFIFSYYGFNSEEKQKIIDFLKS